MSDSSASYLTSPLLLFSIFCISLPPCLCRTIESIYEELVLEGILIQPMTVKLCDYLGIKQSHTLMALFQFICDMLNHFWEWFKPAFLLKCVLTVQYSYSLPSVYLIP